MKLILTRHGETIENQKGIMQGHLPGVLSEKGIEQTKKLALKLKNEKIDCIYSSDLARAADTAREISKFHNIPIIFTKKLRESDLGDWAGKNEKEVNKNNPPKNLETANNLLKRADEFLKEICNKYKKDETILFISHNWINKAIIACILGRPFLYFNRIDDLVNTSLSIFEIQENKKPIIHLMNSSKHLED